MLAVIVALSLRVVAGEKVEVDVLKIPKDFVVVNPKINDANVTMSYVTDDNFVGTPVDGYEANLCFLQERAANALVKVSVAAREKGFRLKIFDCYRPQRAVDHFVRWANDLDDQKTKAQYYPNIEKDTLVGPYIAGKSSHSRGVAVDLTLEQQDDNGIWRALDMGTRFDYFDSRSNTFNDKVSGFHLANRQTLIDLMAVGEFVNYSKEWWHFSHQSKQYPQVYPKTFFNFPITDADD